MSDKVREESIDGVPVRYADEKEEAAYQAGYSNAYEFYVLEKGGVSEDTLRVLRFLAGTNGKDFGDDLNKLIEWLLMVAKRNEPWVRFQLDLFSQYERGRTRTSKE